MNKSHYIQTMKQDYGVDFSQLWRHTIGHKSEYAQKRASDDKVEAEFWEGHSKKYDDIPSLMDYAPEVFDRLLEIVGTKKKLIEFGCGTGKFTLPMAKHNEKVTGVDFSKDMLKQIEAKLLKGNISNVDLVHGKIEDVTLDPADIVYGINANYRMLDIHYAIKQMKALAQEKVVIVWTMQRSPYDAILNETEIKGIGRGQEYIQLLNVLYEMGIDPTMEMMTVTKPIRIEDKEVHYDALKELGYEYDLNTSELIEAFNQRLVVNQGREIYMCPLKVAIIHFS